MSSIHDAKEGDILASTWGATMVIVSFYRVVKVTPHTVKIVALRSIETSDGFLCGTCIPSDVQDGPTIYTRRKQPGKHWITGQYESERRVGPWHGKPLRYNHCD